MAVRVEPYGPEHAAAFQVLAADARIAATTLVPHPYPEDGAARLAEAVAEARQRREAFAFAVVAGGAVVGSCSLKHLDWDARQAEIGYWIGVPYWGRGYASAAVRLVTAYGLDALGLRRITAEVLAGNAASERVLLKAGYRRVRTFANPNARHAGAPTLLLALSRPGRNEPGRARVAADCGTGRSPSSDSPDPMGLLDFIKDSGKDLFGGKKENAAASIKQEIERKLGGHIDKLGVRYDDGRVTLVGEAKSQAAKEKASLIAGNVKGVEYVDDDRLQVVGQRPASAPSASRPRYYTIQSGDTLSKIAKEQYGDAGAYDKIFEANREVIDDPDKIYPGQQIRIPAA